MSITKKTPDENVKNNERRYSSVVVDGLSQAPSRAMLRAVGFTDGDFSKSQDWSSLHLEHGYTLQYAH